MKSPDRRVVLLGLLLAALPWQPGCPAQTNQGDLTAQPGSFVNNDSSSSSGYTTIPQPAANYNNNQPARTNEYSSNGPPPEANYDSNNSPPPTTNYYSSNGTQQQNYDYGRSQQAGYGGYTGYAQPQYSSNPDYRYQPTNGYYQAHPPWPNYNPAPYAVRPRYAYAPAGMVIPVTLQTAISTQVAREGDVIQAAVTRNVALQGLSYIPAGSVLDGQVSDAEGGRFFNRSGSLILMFNQLRLPDGRSIPIQAHILGKIGKYTQKNGEIHGEGLGTKVGGFALRAAIGAGAGALLGTAVGAIAGRGYGGYGYGGYGYGGYGSGAGTGAWAGAAIGGGIGVLDALVARRGRNVVIQSGTPLQIQLDDPIQIPQDQPNQQFGGQA